MDSVDTLTVILHIPVTGAKECLMGLDGTLLIILKKLVLQQNLCRNVNTQPQAHWIRTLMLYAVVIRRLKNGQKENIGMKMYNHYANALSLTPDTHSGTKPVSKVLIKPLPSKSWVSFLCKAK